MFTLIRLILVAFFVSSHSHALADDTTDWKVKVFAAVIGQSNELGAGRTPSESEPPAPPMHDPVPPNGGKRSWWPKMATLLAKQNISFRVANTAVGSTSLARSWVGMPVTWKAGELVTKGMLVISLGHVWKCVDAPPPYNIGVATSTPALGKQNDGFSWQDLGSMPPNYDSGRILKEGDIGFDPNGYIAAAFSSLSSAKPDEMKVVIISIGQGDKTFRTSRIQYHDAIKSVSNFFKKRKIKVIVGFTSPIATPGGKDWYTAELKPGLRDFIDENKRDSMVIEGADLDQLFGGSLPIEPETGPGLQSDLVHMNDAAYDKASEAWANAITRWLNNNKN